MSANRSAAPPLVALGTVAVLVAGWLLGHTGGTPPAAAATGPTPVTDDRARDGVLVTGTGKITGRPDTLVADFGTEARGTSVDEALGRADRAIDRVRNELLRGGVDRGDLQTAGIDIYPRYDDNGDRITGYQASQRLTVTFRDVDRAGDLLGKAVSAGGDAARLSGLSFRIDDDSALLETARREAFDDAKRKAQLYGDAAERGLGRVVSVTETVRGNDSPYPVDAYYRATASAAQDVAIEPGQQELSVSVTVEWSFD
jgi:uncharacterized protein